jgi:tetratricopeptide (TPR) repeat protein
VEESEALLVDSCRLWSLNNEGYAALVAGDLVRAEQLLAQALQEDPDYAIAHINLGDVYLAQGHTDQALAEYHTAVDLAPGEARFNHKLADKYHDLWLNARDEERLLLAEKYYQAAITANPGFVEPYSGLANLYIMGGVKLDQAKRHLDDAWAILEGSAAYSPLEKTRLKSALRKNFGLLAYNHQDYAAAITYFEEADALSDDFDIDILGILGVAYQAIEQHDQACAAWLRLEQLLQEKGLNAPEWLVTRLTACKS